MSLDGVNGFLDVESAALRAPQVGIANTNPQHILSVGSNLYVSGDSSDVLTVDGNVVCEGVKVGLIEIIPSYDLEAVANVGNSTSNTILFTNPDTGIVATGNVSVGKTLRSNAIAVLTNLVAGNDQVRQSGPPALEVYGDPSHGGNEPRLELVSNIADTASNSFTRLTSNAGVFSIETGTSGTSDNGTITFGGFSNERLRITSDGNVGIGTTNPVAKLHLTSGQYDGSTLINLTVNQSTDATVYYRKIAFVNNNSGHVLIKGVLGGHRQSQGNANVDVKFSVRDGFTALGTCMGTLGNSNILVKDNTGLSRKDIYLVTGLYSYVNLQVYAIGGEVFGTNENQPTSTAPSGDTTHDLKLNFNTFRVDDDGNVGIGVTNPACRLDIKSEDVMLRGNTPSINFSENLTSGAMDGAFRIRYDGANQNDNNNYLAIQCGTNFATTAIHCKLDGNVGIGTTNPGAKLQTGPVDGDHLYMASSNNSYGWKFHVDDEGSGSVPLRIKRRYDGSDTTMITLQQNNYMGFGVNLDPETHFHFARNTEDDHLYMKFGKTRNNITSGSLWKPYFYTPGNTSTGTYAGQNYYSNSMFFGCGQMEAQWGSNYYGGKIDIRGGDVYAPGNNGSASNTNYYGGDIILQGGITRVGGTTSQTSRTYGGSIIFKCQSTDTTSNRDTNVYERMRVDGPTGNVGIGTADPDGTLHVKAGNRVHITEGTTPVFTGLNTTSEGRAQLVLSSAYSDLVIASSRVNNAHGSTLSFTTVNPENTAEYRKFVINQGNWGDRKDFLDFGLSASTADANPHLSINSTDTVLTLDGNNKRVGINDETPSYQLDVAGAFRATGRIHANSGIDLPASYGYCGILAGTADGASYANHNSIYRTWWSIGVRDYNNDCRILFDARTGDILGTGTVASTSDDRIKINEKRITRAMDTISKLDPQLYHKMNKSSILPNEGEDVLYQTESGLIAQDIWYDAPELRHLVKLGNGADPAIEKPYRNPDITIDPDYSGWGPEPSTVNYVGLIPYLIKSVQEITTELPNVKTGVSNVNVSNVDNYHGLIVSANKPDIYISTLSYDTKCYGVVSEENVDTINNEILINTSRDGKIWVIDVENLQSGDYITTSNVAGYGMKQSDDLVHNYTVAKILQDCDFNPTQVPVKRVARETRDVTYYVKREYSDVPQDGSEAYIPDNKIVEIDEVYYTKSTLVEVQADEDYTSRTFVPEITEEAYDTLDESDRESYAVTYFNTKIKDIRFEEYESLSASEKEEYEQMTRRVRKIMKLIETKDPLPGYEIETRTEEVDVLDSNGQLVWEETSETRVSYTTKYIDGAGVETDEANAVHKAALVNCKVML